MVEVPQQILARIDQQTAAAREFRDDFQRITEHGPDGTERDVIIVKLACGFVTTTILVADLENEES